MKIQRDDLQVARVLSEDDDFVTLEIAKDDQRPLRLNQALDPDAEPDRFLTLLFVRQEGDGIVVWTPWKAGSE